MDTIFRNKKFDSFEIIQSAGDSVQTALEDCEIDKLIIVYKSVLNPEFSPESRKFYTNKFENILELSNINWSWHMIDKQIENGNMPFFRGKVRRCKITDLVISIDFDQIILDDLSPEYINIHGIASDSSGPAPIDIIEMMDRCSEGYIHDCDIENIHFIFNYNSLEKFIKQIRSHANSLVNFSYYHLLSMKNCVINNIVGLGQLSIVQLSNIGYKIYSSMMKLTSQEISDGCIKTSVGYDLIFTDTHFYVKCKEFTEYINLIILLLNTDFGQAKLNHIYKGIINKYRGIRICVDYTQINHIQFTIEQQEELAKKIINRLSVASMLGFDTFDFINMTSAAPICIVTDRLNRRHNENSLSDKAINLMNDIRWQSRFTVVFLQSIEHRSNFIADRYKHPNFFNYIYLIIKSMMTYESGMIETFDGMFCHPHNQDTVLVKTHIKVENADKEIENGIAVYSVDLCGLNVYNGNTSPFSLQNLEKQKKIAELFYIRSN